MLRSQNYRYIITALAPAPLFPLFWLRLQLWLRNQLRLQIQPFIAT